MSKGSNIADGLRFILAPVVRFCLRHSIKYQTVMEETKQLFAVEGERLLGEGQRKQSLTRISLMSGVHRKDISRILRTSKSKGPKEDVVSRVLGLWQMGIEYRAPTGAPKLLTYRGRRSEFWNLVLCVSSDVSPYSVLKELERIGAVEKIGGEVKLVTQMHQLASDPQEAYLCAGEDIDDLLCTIEENLKDTKTLPGLHIKTDYDSIPEHYAAELREWLLDEGSAFHKRVREKLSRYDQDLTPPERRTNEVIRVAVGSFGRLMKVFKGR